MVVLLFSAPTHAENSMPIEKPFFTVWLATLPTYSLQEATHSNARLWYSLRSKKYENILCCVMATDPLERLACNISSAA